MGVVADAERESEKVRNDAADMVLTAARPLPPKDVSPIKVHDGVFLGSKSVKNENGDPLPRAVEREGVTLVSAAPLNLRGIAQAVTDATGIPVVISSSSIPESSGRQSGGDRGNAANDVPIDPLAAALMSVEGGNITGGGSRLSASSADSETMRVNFSGSLSNFLHLVSSHFDVAWKYEGNRIVLEKFVTRNFDVPALPIISELEFTLDSSSSTGGGASSSSSGQSATTESAFDIWEEIKETMDGMVGESGFVNVNTATGTVTVTSSPTVVSKVRDYLQDMNKKLSQQVAISVQVLNVSLRDSSDYGLDLNVMRLGGKHGINFGNTNETLFSALQGGGQEAAEEVSAIAVNSVDEAARAALGAATAGGGSSMGWALLDLDSKWLGTGGMIRALEQKGDVSVVTSASVTTVSGAPVPLQVANTRGYISERSVESGGDNNGDRYTITQDEVTVGFNLHLVPRVLRDGNLLLQYGMNISSLVGPNDGFHVVEDPGGGMIMMKDIDQRNFVQQTIIPNGNTLVLAGFEQMSSSHSKSGVGSPDFMGLGGRQSGAMQRDIIVIMITPTLLDVNRGGSF